VARGAVVYRWLGLVGPAGALPKRVADWLGRATRAKDGGDGDFGTMRPDSRKVTSAKAPCREAKKRNGTPTHALLLVLLSHPCSLSLSFSLFLSLIYLSLLVLRLVGLPERWRGAGCTRCRGRRSSSSLPSARTSSAPLPTRSRGALD